MDASIFDEHEAFGIGPIAKDYAGELIQAKSKVFQGKVSPELAEAIAIKEVLSWMILFEGARVIIESNCLVDVQPIRSNTPMPSRFGEVIMEYRKHYQKYNNLKLYFIKRYANMTAHTLSRASYYYHNRTFNRSLSC